MPDRVRQVAIAIGADHDGFRLLRRVGNCLTPSGGLGINSEMYRTPSILRLSVHREAEPEPIATLNAPTKPPVAQCAAFIRLCRDSLVPLLDRSAIATPKELRILKELRSERGDCAAAIRTTLAIDDGEMSRLIARLAARNLVSKTPGIDRRKSALWLTPTGRALVDRTNWAEYSLLEARLEALTPAEQSTLRQAMAAVTALLCGASPA